jgi:ribosomal protein L35
MSTTKTNKSYLKRMNTTKNGKLIARKPGQNHYNAKERTGQSLSKRRTQVITMSNKARSRFLATSN